MDRDIDDMIDNSRASRVADFIGFGSEENEDHVYINLQEMLLDQLLNENEG